MGREHRYSLQIRWTGNRGQGTSSYDGYSRSHEISADPGKPVLPGSSDPAFRGDPGRWNPEELLVSSLSSCHMLWFLHLASVNRIVVTDYVDRPSGLMREDADGGGRFEEVVLRPEVTIAAGDRDKADQLHHEAHRLCFIANSVNFRVNCDPTTREG